MRISVALATALLASTAAAQTPTSVERAKSDLDSCLRANADLTLATASGAPAAAKAALKLCKTESGKLDRAIARASTAAGKTATQNKAATAEARKAVLTGVESFLAAAIAPSTE